MERVKGKIDKKDGQDIYIKLGKIGSAETMILPEKESAIIIENDVIQSQNNKDIINERIENANLEIDADSIRFVLNVVRVVDPEKYIIIAHSAEEQFDDLIKAGMEVWVKPCGYIKKIQGPIVEIEFSVEKEEHYNELPNIYDVLAVKRQALSGNGTGDVTYSYLEVQSHLGEGRVKAIALDSTDGLGKNDMVLDTGGPIRVPVGITGRLFDTLGKPIDGNPEPLIIKSRNGTNSRARAEGRVIKEKIIKEPPSFENLDPKRRIMQTYIKVVDLVAPFPRGGKIGFFGGAGVGKTVFLKELMNTMIVKQGAFAIFSGIGERTREGSEDWEEFNNDENKHLLKDLVFVFGQMNETSGIRFRAGQTAITMAEYFRDKEHRSVIVFIDNIFRYIQAGSEVSTLLGRMPSAVGYQPTLEMELGDIEERISSITYTDDKGEQRSTSITAIQAVYVPADDLTDPAPSAIFAHLDANLVLKREIAELKIYPAVDPLESSSRMLMETEKPEHAENFLLEIKREELRSGQRDLAEVINCFSLQLLSQLLNNHYLITKKIKEILQAYKKLERTINLLGPEELPPDDKVIHQRAIRIKKFLSQPFVVSEQFSGITGVQVPLWDTLFGFLCLAADDIGNKGTYGTLWDTEEDKFLNKGKIDDVEGYGAPFQDNEIKRKKLEELLTRIGASPFTVEQAKELQIKLDRISS
jgi:F-type H+/Na+-transporting ATPase subunit beta